MQYLYLFVSAALSFFAVVAAAKIGADSQLKDRAIDVYLTARLKSFQDLEAAVWRWTVEKSRQTSSDVIRYANEACMVSSDDTVRAVSKVASIVNAHAVSGVFDLAEFQDARLDALECMRKDLSTYPVPAPTEYLPTRIFRILKSALRRRKPRS